MKAPAFQFYPDDFLGGVADMTQAEVGAYILLLCAQWGRGEIPLEADRVAMIAKGPVSQHVMAKFPGGRNQRMEQVRQKLEDFRKACSDAGRKGGGNPNLRSSKGTFKGKFKGGLNSPSPTPSPTPTAEPITADKPPRKRNALLDALASVGGCDPEQTTDWPNLQKLLKRIQEVCPDVRSEEIRRREINYAKHYPKLNPTPNALVKWWALCENAPGARAVEEIPPFIIQHG